MLTIDERPAMACLMHKKAAQCGSSCVATRKENARDIGLCEPQPDNHTAWSRISSTGRKLYFVGILGLAQVWIFLEGVQDVGRRHSGVGIMPALAEIVCRL